MRMNVLAMTGLSLSLKMLLNNVALAQQAVPVTIVPSAVSLRGASVRSPAAQMVASGTYIGQPGATVQLRFHNVELGEQGFIKVFGTNSNESVTLTKSTLKMWSGYSPGFNDCELFIDLYSQGGTVSCDADAIECVLTPWSSEFADRSVCGNDDRARSNDKRVGRWLSGPFEMSPGQWGRSVCTASILMTGDSIVTAGHCGNDSVEGAMVEFNVPDSTSSGGLRWSHVADQYPVNSSRVLLDFQQRANGLVIRDGMVAKLCPNIYGRTAGIGQGEYMPLSRNIVASSGAIEKWGCGVDTRRPQLSMCPKVLRQVTTVEGNRIDGGDSGWFVSGQIDATGGDSGGPLIGPTGTLIAVSSLAEVPVDSSAPQGSCAYWGYSLSDYNSSFVRILMDVTDAETTSFVDVNSPYPGLGSLFGPYPDLRTVYDGWVAGSHWTAPTIVVAPGTYKMGMQIMNTAKTIRAPLGPVTLVP